MIDFWSVAIGFVIMLGFMLVGFAVATSLFLTAALGGAPTSACQR